MPKHNSTTADSESQSKVEKPGASSLKSLVKRAQSLFMPKNKTKKPSKSVSLSNSLILNEDENSSNLSKTDQINNNNSGNVTNNQDNISSTSTENKIVGEEKNERISEGVSTISSTVNSGLAYNNGDEAEAAEISPVEVVETTTQSSPNDDQPFEVAKEESNEVNATAEDSLSLACDENKQDAAEHRNDVEANKKTMMSPSKSLSDLSQANGSNDDKKTTRSRSLSSLFYTFEEQNTVSVSKPLDEIVQEDAGENHEGTANNQQGLSETLFESDDSAIIVMNDNKDAKPHNLESLKAFLNSSSFSSSSSVFERFEAIIEKDSSGNTMFDLAVKDDPECLKTILENLSPRYQMEAIRLFFESNSDTESTPSIMYLRNTQTYFEGLSGKINAIRLKEKELIKKGRHTEAGYAHELHDSLTKHYNEASSMGKFKEECIAAITKARPVLEEYHHDWKNILLNLVLAISFNVVYGIALVANKMITGHSSLQFFNKAKYDNDINGLDNALRIDPSLAAP
jgi:hypothetical protein